MTDAKGKVVARDTTKQGAQARRPRAWRRNTSGRSMRRRCTRKAPDAKPLGRCGRRIPARRLDDAWWTQLFHSIEATIVSATATLIAVVLSLRFLTRPLRALTVAMGRLAAGETSVPIADTGRHDEIGEMARAVDVFRQNMIEADQLAAEQAAARAARSRRQDAMERDTEAFGVSVAAVMAKLSSSSENMRSGAEAMTRASTTVHQAATKTSDDAGTSSRDLASTASAVEQLTSGFTEIRTPGRDRGRGVAPSRAAGGGEPGHDPEPGRVDRADRRRGRI